MFCCIAGGFFSTLPTVVVELNGIENVVKSMAFMAVAIGTGSLLTIPFSGICQQNCHSISLFIRHSVMKQAQLYMLNIAMIKR